MINFKILVYYYFKTKQTKQKQTTNSLIFKHILQDLIREDLCDEDDISASQDHDTPRSPNPYDQHNASVSQTTKSARTREGRYRSTRSKSFIDRLQTAKREQEESVDFSKAHQRAYIVVNLRKNSNHKVEISKSPSCGCADFVKNCGKNYVNI